MWNNVWNRTREVRLGEGIRTRRHRRSFQGEVFTPARKEEALFWPFPVSLFQVNSTISQIRHTRTFPK